MQTQPKSPFGASVLHTSLETLSLISAQLCWNHWPGSGTQPCLCSPPGAVGEADDLDESACSRTSVQPPKSRCFCPPSFTQSLPHLEAISLVSQSSERCFMKSLPLVAVFFDLFINSWAGTCSSPSLLLVLFLLWDLLCLERWALCWEGQRWSTLPLMVGGPVIWGPFCFAACKCFPSSQGFCEFPDFSTSQQASSWNRFYSALTGQNAFSEVNFSFAKRWFINGYNLIFIQTSV